MNNFHTGKGSELDLLAPICSNLNLAAGQVHAVIDKIFKSSDDLEAIAAEIAGG
jgi:hypothetical protein